jgi:hypothetical protein
MKVFGGDLRQVAVWEPGAKVDLGDYGEIRKGRWERLASVGDPHWFSTLSSKQINTAVAADPDSPDSGPRLGEVIFPHQPE